MRVEVSETVTIITSLMDTGAYPARDIAELYGMRWASELVYLEEKQTLSGGQPVTAATPAGAYRMAAATVAAHQALRIAGAAVAAAIGAEPARISATALREMIRGSIGAGQGASTAGLAAAIEIIRRDIDRHPLRFVTAWRPGRHFPRFTIKKVRTRKSKRRRARRHPAAPAAPARNARHRRAERTASRLTATPQTRPGTTRRAGARARPETTRTPAAGDPAPPAELPHRHSRRSHRT